MNDEVTGSQDRSWLERLAQAFSAEPKTREDLAELLKVAHQNKILDSDALEIMEGALQVKDQQVREIMIPRSQMVMISAESNLEEILKLAIESNHSRFPVIGNTPDDIRGIFLAKDLLQVALNGKDSFDLNSIIRPANIIPESKRLNVLLREFRENRYHMAIVVDEYGSTAGLVTIEDILEEIVGEIEDETDETEASQIKDLGDGSYQVAALTPIEDFNEMFDAGLNDDDFDTIGGILLQNFGHFPSVGETTNLDHFCFEVIDGDRRQIRQLRMTIAKET